MGTCRNIWKFTWHVLVMLAVILVVFLLTVVPWFFTNIITTSRFHFSDPNDGKMPKSYGLDFRPVEFRSADGILLKGWYIPASAPAKGTIVYEHGQNRTRIEMLPEASFGHSLGYNGLVFDLRHQGASGGNMGSVGYWERLDAEGAVSFALAEEKAARPVILWGVSMGAATALMAAAETPEVAAVICDSSFVNYRDMIKHHWNLFLPLPSFPIADEVIYWSAWRANFKPAEFDLEKAVRKIGDRPILFVAVQGDRRMPPDYARTLYAAATSPHKKLVVLGGSRHGEGFKFANKQYEEAVKEFLTEVSAGGQTTSSTSGSRVMR